MKKKIISLVLVSLLFLASTNAQLKGFSVGPYVEAAWPQGDLAATNGKGIGVGIAGDIKIGGKFNIMGSAGYLRFARNGESGSNAITAVPIRVGLKYRLPFLYIKMESGTAKMNDDHGTALILSPGIGIRLFGLDIQGSYESWLAEQGKTFAALKVAYHF